MIASLILIMSSYFALNTNGPTYTVEKKIDNYEIRRYDSWIVAQTTVKSTHQDAGNQAFNILGGYIFGSNDQKVKIQMTAPVTQQLVGEGQYLVQFFMPKQWTIATLPRPNDPRVVLKTLPERRVFVERYVGGWSEKLYADELSQTQSELLREQLTSKGEPIWAKYNSPMVPTMLRTNEIIFELASSSIQQK